MEKPTKDNAAFDIIVVDSDPARRRHYIDNVAPRTDHHFTYIDTAEEFLRRLEHGALKPLPRIILIALALPGMKGDELVREIRTTHHNLDESPTIVVTGGDARDPRKKAAERAGANIWVGEPVMPWAIDAALHEYAPGRFVIRWIDRNPPAVDGVI